MKTEQYVDNHLWFAFREEANEFLVRKIIASVFKIEIAKIDKMTNDHGNLLINYEYYKAKSGYKYILGINIEERLAKLKNISDLYLAILFNRSLNIDVLISD